MIVAIHVHLFITFNLCYNIVYAKLNPCVHVAISWLSELLYCRLPVYKMWNKSYSLRKITGS